MLKRKTIVAYMCDGLSSVRSSPLLFLMALETGDSGRDLTQLSRANHADLPSTCCRVLEG